MKDQRDSSLSVPPNVPADAITDLSKNKDDAENIQFDKGSEKTNPKELNKVPSISFTGANNDESILEGDDDNSPMKQKGRRSSQFFNSMKKVKSTSEMGLDDDDERAMAKRQDEYIKNLKNEYDSLNKQTLIPLDIDKG